MVCEQYRRGRRWRVVGERGSVVVVARVVLQKAEPFACSEEAGGGMAWVLLQH